MKKLYYIFVFFFDICYQKINQYHLNKNSSYQIMRILYRISNGKFTEYLNNLLSKKIKNNCKINNSYLELESIKSKDAEYLKNEIEKMKLYNLQELDFHIKKKHFSIIDNTFGIKDILKKDLIRADVFKQEIFSNYKISKMLTEYINKWEDKIQTVLNKKAKLLDITSWLTFPNNDKKSLKYDAQIWHRDVNKLSDIKLLIYLSDVTNINDGPFEIIDNSHNINQKIFYDNKVSFRISDEKLKKEKIYDKKSFYGKKGKCFIANTRAFHRGAEVGKNYRIILELYFSSSIFGKHEFYNPYTRPKLDKNWPSYEIWDENIKNNRFLYESIFLGKM